MLRTNCDVMCDVIDGLIRKSIVGFRGEGEWKISFVVDCDVCMVYGLL